MREEKQYIEIVGARVNNLKNISLKIEANKLVVITGLSGSGKSSLAFDTLFAEGQRRYVESLSAYARQFLGRINKPEVDKITGISPAIAIEQRVSTRNPRSTVGTSTEIYDYLKLFFARAGETFSPISGKKVYCHNAAMIVDFIFSQNIGDVIFITAEVKITKDNIIEKLIETMQRGYDRVFVNNEIVMIVDFISDIDDFIAEKIDVLIEKLELSKGSSSMNISDSVSQAIDIGHGRMTVYVDNKKDAIKDNVFSTLFELDSISFEHPSEQMFGFNNPIGACEMCKGEGNIVGIDEDLVIPDKSKSIFGDAIIPWRGEGMRKWKQQIIDSVESSSFPIHKPYYELSSSQKETLWKGSKYFSGIDDFFAFLEKERYKIQYKVMISRYTGRRKCPVCNGGRLKKEALYVKIGGYTIVDFVRMPINELYEVFNNIELNDAQKVVGERILIEIKNRLSYLIDVGLNYLSLDRLSSTLSGGESQRISLSSSLGSSLVGSMYILDEPSIGLHPRDTQRLIGVLKQLRDLGNSVIVVEHDAEVMNSADFIVDIGPEAGINGGEVVFSGDIASLSKAKKSLTADYLLGRKSIEMPKKIRSWNSFIEIKGARENNLKNIDVKFPLGVITCITGVSGSGKSSLVRDVLYPALNRHYNEVGKNVSNFDSITGDLNYISGVELVDQNPMGHSSRSNPVTYIKVYDEIRKLFSAQQYAKTMGYTPSTFSFNMTGGRCEECQGDGIIRVEMQFMADVIIRCEHCNGQRFKDDVLGVLYNGKNIAEVLDLSVSEAIIFFDKEKSPTNKKIVEKLKVLDDVGLGYIKLGQSSSTLSGGESQRVKLAYFLLKENGSKPLFFIFDEPTTGLHFHDIKKLMNSINSLIENGHTAVIVEHNMDVVKCADWVIDLGPEGGHQGGNIVFQGPPSQMAKSDIGYTAKFLKKSLLKRK